MPSVCIRYEFAICSGCLLPACLPAITQTGSRYSYQYGTSYHEYSIVHQSRTRTRRELVPGVGRTVLYCTTCRYGSPHFRTVCVRYAFGESSVRVRYAFEICSRFVLDACLPACLPVLVCMQQAGSRYSYQYGTSYHEYSYISRTRGRSYGTVGAAMRPRCGDPPNKVCTAVGKLDLQSVCSIRPQLFSVFMSVIVTATSPRTGVICAFDDDARTVCT